MNVPVNVDGRLEDLVKPQKSLDSLVSQVSLVVDTPGGSMCYEKIEAPAEADSIH